MSNYFHHLLYQTRTGVYLWYRGNRSLCYEWDYSTVKELKERKSKKEGLDVTAVDLVHEGKRMDDDKQWWETGAFDVYDFTIYMYSR